MLNDAIEILLLNVETSLSLQIAHFIDPDHFLGRAHRSGNESVFRRLIEIALTHNLDDYEKTRFFEGLLVFQCKFSFQCGQSLVLSTRPDIEIETREFKLGDISSYNAI